MFRLKWNDARPTVSLFAASGQPFVGFALSDDVIVGH